MLKTITFAICHFTVAFTVAYYFHEKVWDRIRARKQAEPDTAPAGHNGFFHSH